MIVRVWFNLHRKDWSVKRGSTRVTHHRSVSLRDAVLVVSERARQQVLGRRVRSVHAYAKGTLVQVGPLVPVWHESTEVSYNPYRGPLFYRRDTGASVVAAEVLYFMPDGRMHAVNLKGAEQ